MKKNMICIMCPMGCTISVEEKDGKLSVTGNTCLRGAKYAEQEYVSPQRVVTALVKLNNGKVAPVKTDKPIAKGDVFKVLEEIGTKEIRLPVHIGDRVIENVCGSGANVVVTKNINV